MNFKLIDETIKQIIAITIRENGKTSAEIAEICRREIGSRLSLEIAIKMKVAPEVSNQMATAIYGTAMQFIKRM